MIVLGLETSGREGGAAVLRDGELAAELLTGSRRSHSARLMLAIEHVLAEAGCRLEEVDRIAVSLGPGSFTGVRIGVATAKTLAWSLARPVVGVDTLSVMAAGLPGVPGLILPLRDAYKGEVYAGLFEAGGPEGPPRALAGPAAARAADLAELWRAELAAGGEPLWLLGDGLTRYRAELEGCLPGRLRVVDPVYWPPRPALVAALAARLDPAALPPERSDPIRLAPLYVRRSEAELKRERGQGRG